MTLRHKKERFYHRTIETKSDPQSGGYYTKYEGKTFNSKKFQYD